MKFGESTRGNATVWAVAVLAALAHAAVGGRYDIFRNELYYIVCGRHPAFGYADQPPLVPLLAALTQGGGLNVWLLRLPAALAAGGLVALTAAFARLLGGGATSATLAAIAAAIAPAMIAMTQVLTTSTFEPLAWTACAYLLTRAVLRDDRTALAWCGVAAGIAMQAKYGIAIWLAGLLIGLLATPARRLLATRQAGFGALAGLAIAAPSLIWQMLHGWPFLAVMQHHSATHSNLTGTPAHFMILQALAMNLLLAPLWILGLVGPFAAQTLRPARFLSVAFVAAATFIVMAEGKDYYLFPAYPTLFALGAACCARLPKLVAGGWMMAATANSALLAPVVLPLLSPPGLAAYLDRYHLRPAPDELAAVGAPLTQVFSDELGWRELEKSVAAAYRALPPQDQAHTAIIAANYGEAAAIDVYGRDDHLPPALTGQNQYYFWGPRGFDGSITLHVAGDPDRWRRICETVDIVGHFGVPYAMPYERDQAIFVCRGLRVPLAGAWEKFKRFQ